MGLIKDYHKDDFTSAKVSIKIIGESYSSEVLRAKEEGKDGEQIHFGGINQAFATFAKVFSPIIYTFQKVEPNIAFLLEMMPFLKLKSAEGKKAISLHLTSLLYDLSPKDEKWLKRKVEEGLEIYLKDYAEVEMDEIEEVFPSWMPWVKYRNEDLVR